MELHHEPSNAKQSRFFCKSDTNILCRFRMPILSETMFTGSLRACKERIRAWKRQALAQGVSKKVWRIKLSKLSSFNEWSPYMDLPGIPAALTDFEVAQLRLVHGHTVGQASAYTWLWKKPAMDTRWYENIKQCNNFQKQRIWHFIKQIVQELPSATCSRRNTLLSTHMAIKIVVLRTYGQLSQTLVGSAQRSQVTPLLLTEQLWDQRTSVQFCHGA